MQILFFHPLTGHLWRGIERTVVCLASSLADEGHDVSILTLRHPERALLGALNPQVTLVEVPRSRYFAYAAAMPFFAAHLLTHEYDAIITFFGGFGIGPALALAGRRRPLPLYLCPCYPVDIAPHRYCEIERWGLDRTALQVWAAGPTVADQASKRFGRDVYALPQGVDAHLFAPDPERRHAVRDQLGLSPSAPVILTVAALSERKGIQHVVAALPLLRAVHPNVIYLVAGEGEYRLALEQQIAAMEVTSQVMILGARDTVEDLYKAADVVCLLSHGEANPMVVYEALAAGLPLVTTSHPPFPEILDAAVARMLPDTAPQTVTSALTALLAAPEERARMGTLGRRLAAERSSFDRLARVVTELIQRDGTQGMPRLDPAVGGRAHD
jgi:glycosyltransferase involved in cell wall biosynthesis